MKRRYSEKELTWFWRYIFKIYYLFHFLNSFSRHFYSHWLIHLKVQIYVSFNCRDLFFYGQEVLFIFSCFRRNNLKDETFPSSPSPPLIVESPHLFVYNLKLVEGESSIIALEWKYLTEGVNVALNCWDNW